MTPSTKLLVIGYGNELRGDDGVGPRVAATVAGWDFEGVQAIICPLLTPELADPISKTRLAVFVDAAVDCLDEVQLSKLEPNQSSQVMAHAANPETMLALARDVFGHVPQAWQLKIPALKLEFGQQFSSRTLRALDEALEKLRTLCRSLQVS
jgi:hydrogenase maturation protease